MVKCFHHLEYQQSHLLFFELPVLLEHVEQRLLHQLKHHKQLGLVLERVQQLYYVRMTLNQLENGYFPVSEAHRLFETSEDIQFWLFQ